MEREDLIAHLTAWCDGIDPATGAPLPPDHPAQRTDTLRVLQAALGVITRPDPALGPAGDPPTAVNPPRGVAAPTNAGRPWSDAEDTRLAAAHQAGSAIAALARAHERTRGAITARLVRLGRIEAPPGMRLRGEPPSAAAHAKSTLD
jgi:hypothetical protein